jgi:choline kinase
VSAGIDKAVILAAGSGNRIAPASRGLPKPLLPLGGADGDPCFLDWHVRALSERGVREIVIVGNRATFERPLRWGSPAVRWALNPADDLSRSGSGDSAAIGFASRNAAGVPALDGASRVVLMDADILYDPRALDVLTGAGPRRRSATLVCSEYRQSQEEVMVFGAGDLAAAHGKGLLGTGLVAGLEVLGEATGILLWEPADHAPLREVCAWALGYSTAKARSEHEDLTQRMMMLGRVEAARIDGGFGFMEVDTPDEYAVLCAEVYPRLKQRLGW